MTTIIERHFTVGIDRYDITTKLIHLTEPLQVNEQIIVGLNPFIVKAWDLKHSKQDILNTTANHGKFVRIVADPA